MEFVRGAVEPLAQNIGVSGRGAHLIIPSLVGPIVATILVFNRIYWRISLVHTLALDDLCITLSLVRIHRSGSDNVPSEIDTSSCKVFLYLLCIANIVGVNHGYGRPAKSLNRSDLQIALQVFP